MTCAAVGEPCGVTKKGALPFQYRYGRLGGRFETSCLAFCDGSEDGKGREKGRDSFRHGAQRTYFGGKGASVGSRKEETIIPSDGVCPWARPEDGENDQFWRGGGGGGSIFTCP